jgi:hypothetical protein
MNDPLDWTDAEVEKFTDALVREINFGDVPKQPPIEWYTSAWNGPVIKLDSDDPFGDMERIFRRGIHITSIVPPEQGWPIAMHCPICKETTFMLSLWAVKPKDGDYFLHKELCASEEFSHRHNMELATKRVEFQLHNPLPLPEYLSMMEFTKLMPIEEVKKRWPDTPIPGETK